MNNTYYIPYFTYKELACKQTGKIVLATGFAEKLVNLRKIFNKPMSVSSGCRSREYNKKINEAENSFHIYDYPHHSGGGCCAVDVLTLDKTIKGDLIATAWQLDWAIGIHKNFVHLNRRIDYTELKQIIFLY
jgi:hypothetical protein